MKTIFLGLLIFSAISASAQISERDRGIELYKKGDSNLEAVRVLETVSKNKETKNDGQTWNYLGLAYISVNNFKQARKALEKAVKFSPQDSAAHSNLAYVYLSINKPDKGFAESEISIKLNPQNVNAFYTRGKINLYKGKYPEAIKDAENVIAIDPKITTAYILKSDALLDSFSRDWQIAGEKPKDLSYLVTAKQVLESCQKVCPNNNNLIVLNDRTESIKAFLDYFEKQNHAPDLPPGSIVPDPNEKGILILSKPRANYTDEARQTQTQGTITLAVLFGADDRIKFILVLKGLGHGLNEEAVKAAQGINFQAATKDGKPIPVVKMVQYSFTIY